MLGLVISCSIKANAHKQLLALCLEAALLNKLAKIEHLQRQRGVA